MKNRLVAAFAVSQILAPHSSLAADCIKSASQMFMVRVAQDPAPDVGGVILFGSNFARMKEPNEVIQLVNRLQRGRRIPLFIAIDQEGGAVQRLNGAKGFTDLPSPEDVGKADDKNLAYDIGRLTAEELSAVGINWNFGTVLDVNSNPDNPVIGRHGRSLGSQPEQVAEIGLALVMGHIDLRVIPTVKHFPGHGDTVTDSHKGLAAVNKSWQELERTELVPFRSVLKRAPVSPAPAVMIGHLSLPKILGRNGPPASLSKDIVTDFLRKDIGHDGLIVTDDLIMGAIGKFYQPYDAVKRAILAGNDVLILGAMSAADQKSLAERICRDARGDRELSDRIAESSARILRSKRDFGILDFRPLPPLSGELSTARGREIVRRLMERAQANGGGVPIRGRR